MPLQSASLYDGQEVFVWSDCLLDLGTDFLVGNMVFVRQHSISRQHVNTLPKNTPTLLAEKKEKNKNKQTQTKQ